jgi:phospholipid transport system substrate-binding protein
MTGRTSGPRAAAGLAAAVWLGVAVAAEFVHASPEPGPRATIEQMADRVLAVLRDSALSRQGRLDALEALTLERFDFKTMSRLVLARNWKRFSEAEREEFQVEFKRYLARSYGSRIDRYDQEEIEILGEREEPRGDVTVLTRVVGGEFDGATLDFRLRGKTGRWLIIDVIAEGISFVSNYRDQFREVLGGGGPQHLLKQLREKNAAEPAPPGE